MATSNEVNWPPAVWQEINEAVVKEISKGRVAQQVWLPTQVENSPTEVVNEVIDFSNFSIREGLTKSYVELYQEFALTSTQVTKESELKTCKTLARMAAKALALAEDSIIFSGVDGALGTVRAENLESAGKGLLGEANPGHGSDSDPTKVSVPISVPQVTGRTNVIYGENVHTAVAQGVAKLRSKLQGQDYALFLPINVYVDTCLPPMPGVSLIPTNQMIRPFVEGGYYGTITLPAAQGLLVALNGEPIALYVGQEATTEFVRKERASYFFRVVERIQFVVRDPRALVLLQFQ